MERKQWQNEKEGNSMTGVLPDPFISVLMIGTILLFIVGITTRGVKTYTKKLSGNSPKLVSSSPKYQRIRTPIPGVLRHEVFKRDGYKCVECGAKNNDTTLHIDHKTPIAQGGTDELDNLQTLCGKCNLAKSNRKW